jgi:hypothetical protein
MSIVSKIASAALMTGMVALAPPAHATETFAQFLQTIPSARIFTYNNAFSLTKAKLGTVGGSDTVLISDLGTLLSPSIAKVSLVGTATALPAIVGPNIEQLFTGTLTFTLLAPQLGMSGWSTNALKVTFTDAVLIASPGGLAPTLQANSGSGSIITYESDFADLTGVTAEDFSLSFSGSSAALTLSGGRLPNFHVSGSGTFAAVLATPEPASWSMMLGGFGLIGLALRSRRKAAVTFA